MEKTLNTIQTLSKIGKILSKIVFIFCIVGAVMCAAGIAVAAFGAEAIKTAGIDFGSFIDGGKEMTAELLSAVLVSGIVSCIGEGVTAKFSEIYFKNELKAGTPFTFDGAKELLRLGIIAIAVSLSCSVVNSIVYKIAGFSGSSDVGSDLGSTIGIGIMFIVMSVILKYGAEKMQNDNRELPEQP